jgi:hypothetical protein
MKKDLDKDIVRIKKLMDLEMDEDMFSVELEFSEEEAAASSTGSGPSAGYPTVTKWESGATRGKANPIANNKWESGVTRGKSNTLL